MRFLVRNSLRALTISLFLACATPESQSAGTRADCGPPPGGYVTCEDGQFPFCRVTPSGQVFASCKTPAKNLHGAFLKAWILSEVMQRPIGPAELKESQMEAIFQSRNFKMGKGEIRFQVPPSFLKRLDSNSPSKAPQINQTEPPSFKNESGSSKTPIIRTLPVVPSAKAGQQKLGEPRTTDTENGLEPR